MGNKQDPVGKVALGVRFASRLDAVVPIRYVRMVASSLLFLFGFGALAGAAGSF